MEAACRSTAYTSKTEPTPEARYSEWLKPGDEIHINGTSKALVVDVVPVMEHDDDRYGGMLMIRPL